MAKRKRLKSRSPAEQKDLFVDKNDPRGCPYCGAPWQHSDGKEPTCCYELMAAYNQWLADKR